MLKYCSERETDGAVHKKKKKKIRLGALRSDTDERQWSF